VGGGGGGLLSETSFFSTLSLPNFLICTYLGHGKFNYNFLFAIFFDMGIHSQNKEPRVPLVRTLVIAYSKRLLVCIGNILFVSYKKS